MLKYEFVNLPDTFIKLLCTNMQTGSPVYNSLSNFISNDRGFTYLVKNAFIDIDPNGNVKRILSSLGWNGFRDRMALVYLNYLVHGQFTFSSSTSGIDDIKAFDDAIRPFAVDGYSRGFLLGLYMKMLFINLKKNSPQSQFGDLLINEKIIGLLDYSNAKIVEVDWTLLILNHYASFIGLENLKKMLQFGANYEDLYQQISDNQKKVLIKNLLAYGSSIGDQEFFYKKTI